MNIKKTIGLAVLMLLLPFASFAQGHFDWVKSYFGPDFQDGAVANEIFGSEMDSEGNVYILGQFIGNARWDNDSSLLPFSANRNRSAVVAKFSPNGDMVWHKEFYSSNEEFDVYSMRMVGDTALLLYAMFRYPYNWGSSSSSRNEVYYMDTLLTTAERFPQSPDSLESPDYYYAFITIGLEDGSLIEDHFWIPTFVKHDGSLLRDKYTDYLRTNVGQRTSFNVDSEGNIILARLAIDYYADPCDTCPNGIYIWSPTYGNISTMRLLVDGATKQLDVPLEPSSPWNWQIVKLSPHLDSVIASTYVFDSTSRYDYNENISMYLNSVDIDVNDNIYLTLCRTQYPLDRLPVKNSDTLAMEWLSCMIRYNSDLAPTGLAQVIASYEPGGGPAGGINFLGTYYDSVTNSLFINGTAGRDPQYTTLNYNGETLNLMNNACWLRLDADDLSLASYGKARSTANQSWEKTYFYSDKYEWAHNGSFVASGNRVFCQVEYQSNILFENNRISNPYGMGLMVWDYDGHELEYIDYYSTSSSNEQGYIHIKDSSLWLSGTITSNTDFGDIQVNAAYNSHAYIAHYTDTAFMTPYVHSDPPTEQIDETEQPNCQIYPNPTGNNLFINVSNESISNVYITSSQGKRMEIKPYGNRISLSNFPPGIYYLQVTTNRNTYQQKIIKI